MNISNNVSDIFFTPLKMKFLRSHHQKEDCNLFNEEYRGHGFVDIDNRFGRENGKFFRLLKLLGNNLPGTLRVHNKIIHAKDIATIRTEYAAYRNCSQ